MSVLARTGAAAMIAAALLVAALPAAADKGKRHTDTAPLVFIQSFETANLKYLRSKTSVRLVQLVDADAVNPDGTLAFSPPFDKPCDWVVSGRSGLYGDLVTPQGLAEVRTYADGIGPWKPYLISSACKVINNRACADSNGDGLVDERDRALLPPSNVVANAHQLGLLVHPYTFRNELKRLTSDYAGNPVTEYLTFYDPDDRGGNRPRYLRTDASSISTA